MQLHGQLSTGDAGRVHSGDGKSCGSPKGKASFAFDKFEMLFGVALELFTEFSAPNVPVESVKGMLCEGVVFELSTADTSPFVPFFSRRQRPRHGLLGLIAALAKAAAVPATYMQMCWPQELLNGMPKSFARKVSGMTSGDGKPPYSRERKNVERFLHSQKSNLPGKEEKIEMGTMRTMSEEGS